MKAIKKGLYIITLIISLFIINNKAKAYDIPFSTDFTFNEDYIYERFIETWPDFDIKEYSNIHCSIGSSNNGVSGFKCYAFNSYTIENLNYLGIIGINNRFQLNDTADASKTKHYYFFYLPSTNSYVQKKINNSLSDIIYISNNKSFTNFDLPGFDDSKNASFNLLDFNKYINPVVPEEPEEVPEIEINTKATKLLDFMIDKAKNIYEVLINNEIFKLILSIPLIYLVFLALSRIIKK